MALEVTQSSASQFRKRPPRPLLHQFTLALFDRHSLSLLACLQVRRLSLEVQREGGGGGTYGSVKQLVVDGAAGAGGGSRQKSSAPWDSPS